MKIIPLAFSQTNWTDFLSLTISVAGRSPTRSLDKANIRPGDPFSFIAALGELENQDTSPRDAILKADHILRHLSVSFMAHISDRELLLLQNIPFVMVSQFEGKIPNRGEPDQLLILSGTLLDWQACLPLMLRSGQLTSEASIRRELFGTIYNWFKKMNLRELFNNFGEVPTTDGLFRLEPK